LSEAPRTRLATTLALLAATALVAASTAITEGTAHARADEDAEEVALMLEERCYRCHGPDKQKSGLRFDLVEDLRKVIVPRAAPDSELFRRIALPIDAEDAMPPKGPRVSEDRLLAVLRWINAGALFPITEEQELESTGERTRELALIERVRRESGARVLALRGGAQEDALLVDFSLADASPGEAGVRSLDPIAGRIVELSLAGRDVSSAIATKFPSLPALERLHLERTGVDDAALEALVQRAPRLHYLNLHSTRVTGRALEAVARLGELERLVLHDTGVLQADLIAFRTAHPDVHASTTLALPDKPFEGGGPRRILAADASMKRIALLQETALHHFDVLWEHPLEALHDLQVLENGNVLFQETWTRLVEIDPDSGERVWSYDAAKATRDPGGGRIEVHSFRRLEDGVTMIAESGSGRIIEVDREGKLQSAVALRIDAPDPHHDTRLVRKTASGTYLVAHEADGVVREYDPEGSIVWSYEVPLFERDRAPGNDFDAFGNQVFSAERLENGNTLVATGNGHSLIEVTPTGEIAWSVTQDELEGIRLAWVTTVQVLDNGNLVLGNCHAGEEQPQLIEITRTKDVVWTFRDFEHFANALSNAWVIEDPRAR